MIQIPNYDTGVPDVYTWQDIILFALINVVIFGSGAYFIIQFLLGHRRAEKASREWMIKNNFVADEALKEPFVGFTGYNGLVSGTGTVGGRQVMFGSGNLILGQRQIPIVFFNVTLDRKLSGHVLIRQSGTSWVGQMFHVPLEGVPFKKFLTVHADPKPLAQLVVHPDFMAWYEDHRPRPMMYISDHQCCIFFQKFANQQLIDTLSSYVPDIVRFIERSGALE